MGDEKKYPHSLEGALRFAVEHTGSDVDSAQPLSEERRQFLQGALSQLSGPSPTQRMQVIVKDVTDYLNSLPTDPNPDDETKQAVYELLEELAEWCENIDLGCDFHKIGGFSLLPALQASGDSELEWRCGDLIAGMSQNNPYCQQKLLAETEQLSHLMSAVESTGRPDAVRVKSLYALSAMVRGSEEAQKRFVDASGYELLLRAMQDRNSKICTKATFLLMSIMKENPDHKADMTKMGCAEQLVTILNREHDSTHEHVLSALLELLTDNEPAVEQARQSSLHLQQFIRERKQLISGQPEYEEELLSLNAVNELVFPPDCDDMDR